MLGYTPATSQIVNQQQLSTRSGALTSPYATSAPVDTPKPAPSLMPWIVGGVLLSGGLYLLLRD